jgi:hypothetical protein
MNKVCLILVLVFLAMNANADCRHDKSSNSFKCDDGKTISLNKPTRPLYIEFEAAKAFHLYGVGKDYFLKAKPFHDSILANAKKECGITDDKLYGGKILVEVLTDGGVYTVSLITKDEQSLCVSAKVLTSDQKYPEHDMGYYTFAVDI